jgi:DNA-directed RNA polymerase specialized sigma24 family protein
MQMTWSKKHSSLTADAFQRFLAWLDEGTNSEGQRYLQMRSRLVAYFDRKNCATADELADETLNRVARRLEEEGGVITETPAKYCYIVARFVFMEHLRAAQRETGLHADIKSFGSKTTRVDFDGKGKINEKMLGCLEQCAGKLESLSREIIMRYYVGQGPHKINNRRALADELGISVNALSIRACRIRDRLEACVKECVGVK